MLTEYLCEIELDRAYPPSCLSAPVPSLTALTALCAVPHIDVLVIKAEVSLPDIRPPRSDAPWHRDVRLHRVGLEVKDIRVKGAQVPSVVMDTDLNAD